MGRALPYMRTIEVPCPLLQLIWAATSLVPLLNKFKVVGGFYLRASAGPSWRPMTRLGCERPGISTALPVSSSDWMLRLSTSYEVCMACVPPAQTDSSRESMHSGQLERLEAMSTRVAPSQTLMQNQPKFLL